MNSMAEGLIPTFIIEQMPVMSAAEAMCTLVLASATYGQGRRWARLTYADFQQRTMYKGAATIAKALKAITERGLFRRQEAGSIWEVVDFVAVAETGAECRADGRSEPTGESSIVAGDPSLFEVYPSPFEDASSFSEEHPSLTEEGISISEGSGRGDVVDGPNIGPTTAPDGPEIEPLPFNKEKDLTGKVRERRKKKWAREEAPATGDAGDYHPQIPRPRTADEGGLAEHPATAVWLEAGFSWPGWERLRTITRRMGRQPQPEKLRQAREMWLMAGYRIGNIGGILDWYEQICRDPSWRPFYSTGGHTGPRAVPQAAGAGPPPDPTMAMLLKMQEEIANGKYPDYRGMFGFAQSSISQDGVQPAVGRGLPASPG